MITFREFLTVFRETDFTDEDLRRFYYSVQKTVTLRLVGKRSWPEIFRLEEECQWPVLRMIDDPGLSIYKGADKALLERFIRTISEENHLRLHRSSIDRVGYWSRLQSVIDERIGLFTQIFGFQKKDVTHCEKVAERYSRMRERSARRRKKMWQLGIGTGAATLAGAAALWYISKKERK